MQVNVTAEAIIKKKKSNACTKRVRLNTECRNIKSYRNCTTLNDLQILL